MKNFIKVVTNSKEESIYSILHTTDLNNSTYEILQESDILEDLFDLYIVQSLDGHTNFCDCLEDAKEKEKEYLNNLADIFGAIKTDVGWKIVAKYNKNTKEFSLFSTEEYKLSSLESLDSLCDLLSMFILGQELQFNFNDIENNYKQISILKEKIKTELEVLKLIKDKQVDTHAFHYSIDLKDYNSHRWSVCPDNVLNQEEYNLLKKVLKEE